MKMAETSPNGLENTVGKGGIARYEQFLHFQQFLKELVLQGLVWEKVNIQTQLLMSPLKKPFDSTMKRGENAAN